jgi:two-component system sensor histidine kinase RegB
MASSDAELRPKSPTNCCSTPALQAILEPNHIGHAPLHSNHSPQHALLNASWLLKLRWAAVVGQLLTIAIVDLVLRIPLLFEPLLVIIAATAVSNVLLQRWLTLQNRMPAESIDGRQVDLCLGMVSTMDLLSLTALLYATGGATNPFFLFFFLNLGLSAILLPRVWVWGLNLLAIACFTFLLYDHHTIEALELGPDLHSARLTGVWTLFQLAMIVAFAASSSVIVYFLTRLGASLRQQELDLRDAQRRQADLEKLDALGTLAAGTAHELATPLSTIAVVAREVEKAVCQRHKDDTFNQDLVDDIHLIRRELDRCRSILDRMSASAGQTIGEAMQTVTWERVQAEVLDGLHDAQRVDWRTTGVEPASTICVPLTSFGQAVRGLIQNGIDASGTTQRVAVQVLREPDGSWTIRIQDFGHGMEAATAHRVGQPFFTTKPPGKGMGLGVFLADNLIQRLGGSMQIKSGMGMGTVVTIRLPRAVISDGTVHPVSAPEESSVDRSAS